MAKSLVIVESPAKAKTIEKYLGKDFKVASSYGHIRDLPKDNSAIDIKNNFKPKYEITEDKKKIVEELKKLAKQYDYIYLATDDDREGESISWHLKETLNLDDKKTKRIVFREITKSAILNSLKNPRDINLFLVNAQQARRILDRLVGFELSPILWKKIKTGLSAGRVQSVAVRMIVEREREIESFQTKSYFKINGLFDIGNNKVLKAELSKRFDTEEEAYKFLEKCKNANFFVSKLEKKPSKRSPSAPFTTSTLQQEASRKLGFSVAQTMLLAQNLYESGKISYMRTDSVTLSEEAINNALKVISKEFGKNYAQKREYKNKIQNAQEAHEAIRPTDFLQEIVSDNQNENRLYDLIRKRALASQMSDAKLEKTIINISSDSFDEIFIASGEVIIFDGFLKLYSESNDDEENESEEKLLPPLKECEKLKLNSIIARQYFTKPPARYTEATLVKNLEELGIGRPSTYAPTISTIQKRGYVIKDSREGKERNYIELILKNNKIIKEEKKEIVGAEKNKLFPTNIGILVNDFLMGNFENIMDYSFTANVEKEFDKIASGKKEWTKMISDFYYNDFHPKVEQTENLERSKVSYSRELGIDTKTNKKVYVKMGKFGPYVQIGENDEKEKPKYASLKKGQLMESITLEEALDLFKLPRNLGKFEDKDVIVNIGKFGPYINYDGKFYSIQKEDDPYSLTLERAIDIIQNKKKEDAEKIIKTFKSNPDIQILNGRFGPYIKTKNQNIKIPKDKEPKKLTLKECKEIIEKNSKKEENKKSKSKK
ncbi:MAG: DNA topoisomerase 1 [Candidatus Sericytochromatia bacterium]|nr:MAG: DNA topoisomerase 1 [Candidatus Sericytochromatia bacterium]